jgi:hypothetical protein
VLYKRLYQKNIKHKGKGKPCPLLPGGENCQLSLSLVNRCVKKYMGIRRKKMLDIVYDDKLIKQMS